MATIITPFSQFDRVVSQMMSKYSTQATILVEGAGTYDPATGAYTSVDTFYTVNVMVFDFLNKKDGLGVIENTVIQEGDKQVFIQPPAKALGNIPRATIQPNKDRIKIGNITYKIVTSKEVNPSLSNSVLIELYVRQ